MDPTAPFPTPTSPLIIQGTHNRDLKRVLENPKASRSQSLTLRKSGLINVVGECLCGFLEQKESFPSAAGSSFYSGSIYGAPGGQLLCCPLAHLLWVRLQQERPLSAWGPRARPASLAPAVAEWLCAFLERRHPAVVSPRTRGLTLLL